MISFRHHLLSIVAVFVALAVGVILGGGPLSEFGRSDDPAPASRDRSDTAHAVYGDAFAEAAAPTLYGERLEGQQVAVVRLAGASDALVDGVLAQMQVAGAQVAATYEGRDKLTAPAEQGLVDSLGQQLADDLDLGDLAPDDLASHERIGRLLGRAIASTEAEGETADATAGTILEALSTGELLTGPTEAVGRVPMVLVVLGEDRDSADSAALLSGLAEGLGSAANAAVVAGTSASGEGGDLATIRENGIGEVSTVDGAETAVGQVATVLALGAALEGVTGSYGASGVDGAVPVG